MILNNYVYRRRVEVQHTDSYPPIVTRMPAPLPTTWARHITPYATTSTPPAGTRLVHTEILTSDLVSVTGGRFVAALIDPPWKQGEHGYITIDLLVCIFVVYVIIC